MIQQRSRKGISFFLFMLATMLCSNMLAQPVPPPDKNKGNDKGKEAGDGPVINGGMLQVSSDPFYDSLAYAHYKRQKEITDSITLLETYHKIEEAVADPESVTTLTIRSEVVGNVPGDIAKLSRLEELTISRCYKLDLQDLFNKISTLPNLKVLHINFCNLRNLPSNINRLSHLEQLDLSNNKLIQLPSGMNNMTALKTLDLQNNPYLDMSIFWDPIIRMDGLENLNLTFCQLENLDDLKEEVGNIRTLDISNNAFKTAPPQLKYFQNVSELKLGSDLQLVPDAALFENMAAMSSLRSLDVSSCKWKSLPDQIALLKNLEELNLKDNSLTALPGKMGELAHLRKLDVSNANGFRPTNQLTSLPEECGKWTELEELNLSNNKISSLPSSATNWLHLKRLDLSINGFTEWPKQLTSLTSLEVLNLGLNNIPLIPDEIGQLTQLKELNLDGNFFNVPAKKIHNLPASISGLSYLEKLSLRDNVIDKLPDDLDRLSHLQTLDIRNNLLSSLPASISKLTSLQVLNLKANEISSLPADFANLKLTDLNLSFNKNFAINVEYVKLSKMKSLKRLDVSYNNIGTSQFEVLQKMLPDCEISAQDFKK